MQGENAASEWHVAKDQTLPAKAKVVVVGAGIVGCSVAFKLAKKNCQEVVVLERNALFITGGSSSHAPGGILQLHPTSRTMTELARETAGVLTAARVFSQTGELFLASTPERMEYFQWEAEHAARSGYTGVQVLTASEAKALHPLIDESKVLGALHWPPNIGVGRAATVKAAETMALAAMSHPTAPVRFFANTKVEAIETEGKKVVAVRTAWGQRIETEHVVVCAGAWGPTLTKTVGVDLPLVNVQHQWVLSQPLEALKEYQAPSNHDSLYQNSTTDLPCIFDSDHGVYVLQFGSCLGFGNYDHRAILVDAEQVEGHTHAEFPFTPRDFERAKANMEALLPCIKPLKAWKAFNGLMSFTPDGFPLVGPASNAVSGLWLGEGVWVMHSVGVGKMLAEWIVDGKPSLDMSQLDPRRFDSLQLSKEEIRRRIATAYEGRCNVPPLPKSKVTARL
ncbi:Dimethylglycine oxidase [Balamuthia mandrillaris]